MKMYSKDGQTMVDVKKMVYKKGQIAMTAKLMGAYSMTIYLPPEELRASLPLLSYSLIKAIPDMLVSGTKGEEQLRDIGKKLGDMLIKNVYGLLGEENIERIKQIDEATGANTIETIVDSTLALLPVLLAEKPKEEPEEEATGEAK